VVSLIEQVKVLFSEKKMFFSFLGHDYQGNRILTNASNLTYPEGRVAESMKLIASNLITEMIATEAALERLLSFTYYMVKQR